MATNFNNKKLGKKGHFSDKPDTHGHGASALSWIGGGLFVFGIILGATTTSAPAFWVLAGLAVQCWIVAAIIRPIEAIWKLLNDRLPR